MTVEGSGDPSLCRRAALRHLRIVSVIYLVALITGTHWPRLELSGPSGDFDKLIHFFAFGLMIFCFWICNWVTRFISLLVVGLLICFVIEITQVTLSVGRVYSVHDIEAGAFGVVAFAVMIRALRPPADPNALRVRALWERIAFSLISRPSACLVILTSGSFGVLLGAARHRHRLHDSQVPWNRGFECHARIDAGRTCLRNSCDAARVSIGFSIRDEAAWTSRGARLSRGLVSVDSGELSGSGPPLPRGDVDPSRRGSRVFVGRIGLAGSPPAFRFRGSGDDSLSDRGHLDRLVPPSSDEKSRSEDLRVVPRVRFRCSFPTGPGSPGPRRT